MTTRKRKPNPSKLIRHLRTEIKGLGFTQAQKRRERLIDNTTGYNPDGTEKNHNTSDPIFVEVGYGSYTARVRMFRGKTLLGIWDLNAADETSFNNKLDLVLTEIQRKQTGA